MLHQLHLGSRHHHSHVTNHMTDLPNVDAFRKQFQGSKHILIVAGAGLSAASGIPTFRGGGGMWRSLDAMSLATPEAFMENPSLVWQFYHYRRTKALDAKPNAAHEIIAKMSVRELLKKVAPTAESFHLVTQNVDRLSPDALQSLLKRITPESQTDSKDLSRNLVFPNSVIEMHGKIFDVKCTECNYCVEDRSNPLCPALGAADEALKNYHDAGSKNINIPVEDIPRCSACNALARPGVVWFGERPHHLDQINNEILPKADMCLVIGTSSTVSPASDFAIEVQGEGGAVAVINLEPSEDDEEVADFLFRGPCEEILPALFPELID